MPWLEDFQDNVWSKVQWICLPNSIENFGTDLSEEKKKIAFWKKPIAIQIEFHLCQWNLKKANTLKMLWPISHPLEAHLWTIAGASIRAHGGLLVSGLSCILFLLLSALGFFLCSLWVKGCCTCAHLEGRESQPQETFGQWRVRAMKKYFAPLLSQVENSAVHSTWFLLVPQNNETQFPPW